MVKNSETINFKQYNINAIGDKYDKTVFEYDRDQLQFTGGNVFDEIEIVDSVKQNMQIQTTPYFVKTNI